MKSKKELKQILEKLDEILSILKQEPERAEINDDLLNEYLFGVENDYE